jgi:hypothetical protein
MPRITDAAFPDVPDIVFDAGFFASLEHASGLSIPSDARKKLAGALNDYVALRVNWDASPRPGEVEKALERFQDLSGQMARLMEPQATDGATKAAILLIESADDETWKFGNWGAIAEIMQRIERLAHTARASLPVDVGGNDKNPHLRALIRQLHRIGLSCGGEGNGCSWSSVTESYEGWCLALVNECLNRLAEEGYSDAEGIPMMTRPDGTGLGKAIQRALKAET